MKFLTAFVFVATASLSSTASAEVKKCIDAPGGVVSTCATTDDLVVDADPDQTIFASDFYREGQTRSRVGQRYPFATRVILDLYGCSGRNCSNFGPIGSATRNVLANGTWNFKVGRYALTLKNDACAYAVTRVIRVSNGATVVNSRTPKACD